jgi:hypothetical protein
MREIGQQAAGSRRRAGTDSMNRSTWRIVKVRLKEIN